jgi:hypothetical protein
MKTSVVVFLTFLLLCSYGCIKSIAGEEESIDYETLHNRTFGASAREFLSDEKYTSLKLEIQYMEGYKPDKDAIYHLHSFLLKRLHKPQGITIVSREIAPETDKVLSRDEIIAIERKNRTAYTKGNQLAVYILYTNGMYVNDKIFGLAYRNTSTVIFGQNVKENTNKIGKPNRTKLEATILLHEMGHLLGLTGKGSPLQSDHYDENHVSHCKNRKCLMYYGIGTDDKFGYLVKGSIPKLDKDCLADLKANGGK